MIKTIANMFLAFEENNIIYCHWKSNEHLQEALDGDTDLDVLFDPSQRTLLEKTLDECGLKRFRATPLMQYNAIEDFIGFDQESGKIWHLHTHYRMTIGEKHLKGYTVTPWGSYILRNRVKVDMGIYTTLPEDELVLLLCRIALKLRFRDIGGKLGNDDRVELKWLLERVNEEKVNECAIKMVGQKTAVIVMRMIRQELAKKSEFKSLRKQLRKDLKLFTAYNRLTSRLARTNREVFWLHGGVKRRLGMSNYSANRRVSPAGGCVVAILGCDGAGKSTTLNYVCKEFNKKIDVVTIYFGSGDGSSSLLRKPMKMVAQKVGGKGVGRSVEKEYKEKKKVSLKSRMYSLAKIIWAVTLANEKKTKIYQMVKARNNGLLVLTDRYPQSNMPGCSDGPLLSKYSQGKGLLKKLSDWEFRIYQSASINPPDLTIKLMLPTEVAISRKPEMTPDEIETKKSIVMGMNISDHSVVIDTSRSFDKTRGEVMKEIWNLI